MKCPRCGNSMQWRRGVNFEHQMICMKCWLVGEPDNLKQENHMISIITKPRLEVILKVEDGGHIIVETPTEDWSIGQLIERDGKLVLELHDNIQDNLIHTDEDGRIMLV